MPNLQLVLFTPNAIPDAGQRTLALDITQSFLVEAPAGSGKTGLLIQRFLKLLASETVEDPRQVLAITFTRKATAEMLDRVLAQLRLAQSSHESEVNSQHKSVPHSSQSHRDEWDQSHNSPRAATQPASAFDRESLTLAQAVLARDAQLNWNLLDNPNRLNIRTIDSLSQEIASALPILSGSGGAQSPTEDAAPLHAEAARRTLMLLGGDDPALTEALELLLLHRDGNLKNCEDLIVKMLATREQWGELVPLSQPHLNDRYLDETVLPKLDRALDIAIGRTLTRVADTVSQPLLNRLCELAAEMGHLEGYKGNPSPIAVCAGNSMPPAERSEHLDHWRALVDLLLTADGNFRAIRGLHKGTLKFQIQPQHKLDLAEIIDALRDNDTLRALLCSIRTLPPAEYPRDQWHVTKALFRVLARALAELQLVFADRGQCDFTEVGLLARAALRHDSALDDLAASSGSRLQHLLVDEMQDTSTLQHEFIQLLTRRWDGHSQTVFLVGDPKQSIYLFRQARVERFINTLRSEHLGDIPLTTLRLTANFRSQPQLVESFNEDFNQIFATPGAPSSTDSPIVRQGGVRVRNGANSFAPRYPSGVSFAETNDRLSPDLATEIPYTSAHPIRTGTGKRIWHTQPIPADSDVNLYAQLQAQQIRETIEIWRAKPLPPSHSKPWSIAVLVRSRSHLAHIVAALKQSPAIPYRAVEIDSLAERPEILDLLALTRALLHPADRTAWLALLRSPVCGLSLADLHRLAAADPEQTIYQLMTDRGADLSEDGIARLQPLWPILTAALQRRGSLPLSQWVARTWRAFGIPAHLPADALTNAESFFHLLDQLAQPGPSIDLTRLDEKVAKLYAAPDAAPDAVDLMTLHKAKGLEWDVVLVPELHRIGRNNETTLLSWLETSPEDLVSDDIAAGILAPISSKGTESTLLTKWMRSVESAREAAERKRLFYVASTRAREELHLFAAPQRAKSGEIKPRSGSLLHAAWPAAQPHFLAQIITMSAPAQPVVLLTIAAAAPRQIQRIPHLPEPATDGWPILSSLIGRAGVPGERSSLAGVERGVSFAEANDRLPHPRPEGSFSARAFGNTLHSFLELLAAQTITPDLPTWHPRISAVLRANGLPPSEITRLSSEVLRGLTKTLADPEGQWLLAPHPSASSESSLTTADGQIRLDRTFLAGPTPLSTGATHLWIVDYKTTSHGSGNLGKFLAEERERHAPQLETYARELAAQTPEPIRLALYYPMLPHLIWWETSALSS